MDLDKARQTFIIEARELLAAMEESLLAVEGQADQGEAVNAMFRAVHTIKGSAGLFGLDAIVRFSHTVESVMDRVRGHQLPLTSPLVSLVLECHDHLSTLISGLQNSDGETPACHEQGEALVQRLLPFLEGRPGAEHGHPVATRPAKGSAPESERGSWHISARFSADVLRNGMDPLSFIRFLATLGRIVHLSPILDALPAGEAFDPESCYLGYELDLDTEADRQTLEDTFEFVREDSQIRIIPPHSKIDEYVQLIRDLPEEDRQLGEILVAGGSLTAKDLEACLKLQRAESYEGGRVQGRLLGTILIEEQAVPPPVIAAALDKQKRFQDRQAHDLKVVKVPADKLDKLVDLVGELVIAGATARVLAKDNRMLEATAVINNLVEEIRDTALGLRMVQIGETFNRFRRIVRDVSKELGKTIELEIHGADTELDKSIVEKLNDPLMHLVRNSIDHGIEPLDVRRARGKPESGTLILNAAHESGSILIEVSDDGGGLNRARIVAKATERGLIPEGAELSDQEICNLIFEPGFSTAEAVSNLSGRGVGMDVVRRNIDELRGSIEMDTEEGAGTTLRIRLPLTLAIIDGFRVGAGKASYVVPLDMVLECLDLGPFLESEENHLINLRGEVLPFLRLRDVFRIEGEPSPRERVVVVQYGETRAGLVVDRLYGEFQTVIKPLGALFHRIRGIGGSTILGSGEVALILDVPQLVQLAADRQGSESSCASPRRLALLAGESSRS
jgi:two-component system, chemotaxis family, sensor kinase CheA